MAESNYDSAIPSVVLYRSMVGRLFYILRADPLARQLVLLTIVVATAPVLLAIVIDLARYFDLHHAKLRFLSLTRDRTLSELIMDAQMLLAAALAYGLFRRTGWRSYMFGAAALCVLAVDDFAGLHEVIGAELADMANLPAVGSISPEALGELLAFGLVALVMLPLFIWTLLRFRAVDAAVLALYGGPFALFAFFAIGVDLVHAGVDSSVMDRLLGWIEDGGEVMCISLLTCISILQFRDTQSR